ncbi:MAG: NrtA/SsuA/CpmA family ABC transporter substrate-binding protein [Lachnospiraceae bacterium]|nr:NrtA/SsuA/CpmA family ABC transporter substrate-binding protein [Lachnospiraceae bacterium]
MKKTMSKTVKKTGGKIIALIMAATLAAGLTACGSADSAGTGEVSAKGATKELTKVRVGTDTMQLAYAQIIAKQKGYYEEEGIDVEITTYAAGIETINAIVTGAADIGAAYDYALCTRLIPDSNVRVISGFVTNADGSYWYESNRENIQTAADLKGASIGVVKGTLGEYLVAKELESAGLTPADADIKYLSADGEVAAAYVSGQLDAIIGLKPFTEEYEKVEGRHTLNTTGDLGIKSQGFIAADDSFAKDHKDAVAAYLKGTQKALDYIKSDTDDAAQICADYLTVSKQDVLISFDSFTFDVAFPQEDYDHLQDIANWCAENGVLEETKVSDYVVIDPLQTAFPEKVTWKH